MIYTSSFKKSDFENEDKIYILICRYLPKNFSINNKNTKHIPQMSPSHELLMAYKDGLISFKSFKKSFLAQVDMKYMDYIINNLTKSQENDIILICHEDTSEYCHRGIYSEYAKEKYNINIEEC